MRVKLSNSDKLTVISNLGTLLSAGIPILESVSSLREESKGNSKIILEKLEADLNQGKKISESLASFPDAFDLVMINLIEGAESAGTLEKTLADLKERIKKDMEFNSKIKSAMVYPALVIFLFFGIMIMILTFVIPRISLIFSRLKVQIPIQTKILIGLSEFLLAHYLIVISVAIVLIICFIYFYKAHRRAFMNFIFSLPLLSRLAREIDFTRFTRSMELLLVSGIPITDALNLSQNVVAKKEISKVIDETKSKVASGNPMSEAFRENKKIIPRIMILITEAGERSGTLERSMKELSEHFDLEVSNRLKALTILLEPILLVVIGIMVGGIMLSIIAPMYQLIGNIQAR